MLSVLSRISKGLKNEFWSAMVNNGVRRYVVFVELCSVCVAFLVIFLLLYNQP